MTIFPLQLSEIFGHWGSYVVYLIIGFAFGYVLEIAGFGKSDKLAAQFYFKEWTVLKVMFGAIIVAMILIFAATGLGLLDYNLIWVNPTYLWPGIVGGLIMGVGFILGGFCPGTSLVSAATGKVDGIIFVAGVFFGIFLFGETVGFYEDFWYSSYMGRFTLMDLFNVNTGIIVLLITIAGMGVFAIGELSEKHIGKMDLAQFGNWRYGAIVVSIIAAGIVFVIGQPTNADRWDAISAEQEARIADREIFAHPGEILEFMADPKIIVQVIDVRSETDFNLFHILDATHVPLADVEDYADTLLLQPINTLFVVASNDETAATEAWRILMAESVPNVYILEGGINNWVALFGSEDDLSQFALADYGDDNFAYVFPELLGSRYAAANPNHDVFSEMEFESKVELSIPRGPASGGCG